MQSSSRTSDQCAQSLPSHAWLGVYDDTSRTFHLEFIPQIPFFPYESYSIIRVDMNSYNHRSPCIRIWSAILKTVTRCSYYHIMRRILLIKHVISRLEQPVELIVEFTINYFVQDSGQVLSKRQRFFSYFIYIFIYFLNSHYPAISEMTKLHGTFPKSCGHHPPSMQFCGWENLETSFFPVAFFKQSVNPYCQVLYGITVIIWVWPFAKRFLWSSAFAKFHPHLSQTSDRASSIQSTT